MRSWQKRLSHKSNQLLRYCHRRWRQQTGFIRIVIILVAVGLSLRSAVYLVPIQGENLAQVDQAVEFRDRNFRPLGTLLSRDQEHTAVVPLAQVSPHFRHAILAAEDQRFYQHGAVDLRAVVRASWQAIQARRIVSGASTITMQLARMVDPVPRTAWGKAQQVWQAWRIAAGMSKDEILAAYVNRLPMGGNIYGVEAAARVYFGISAADLTVAQASLLAALPNAPTALNPYTHWDDLKQRQRYVLDRMVVDGYLTPPQADRAHAQNVTLQPPDQSLPTAPHFLFWLVDTLPPDHPAQVQTSLDADLQRFVEAQVRQAVQGLVQHQVRHAAALVIHNATGDVLAYVGSPSYFLPNQAGRNDGVQALRQPGSTLKPFLYQLALEQGVIQPNTILADVPTHYPIPGAQLYSPTDFSDTFQGPVRVRAALGNSLNIPAVRILEQVGVSDFLDRLHQLGFKHLDQSPDYYGLGLALGSGEVTLWELAQAYLTLAHQGDSTISLSPLKLNTLPDIEPPSTNHPPTSPLPSSSTLPLSTSPTWPLITHMLSDAHARATAFGVDSVLNLPFPAAVKTGTSSDFRDTWTVGFTTDYTVATWVGNFDGAPMREVSGVTGAAPLWHRIMVHLHEQDEPGQLPPPAGMVKRPICALTGQKPTPDCAAVVQEYFFPEDLMAYESGKSEATVTSSQLQTDSTANATGLHIVSPKTGSRFLLYPSSEQENDQRLKFAIAPSAPTSPIEWRLNGEPLDASGEPSLLWPMRPGRWTLAVQSGHQQDQVQFEVELAADHPARRGFSVRSE
ncbi:MAG: penicillin-binding protein 1C [Leptolyngbya sp. SIO1E4]|nr:penicillin-binding protein 1C [Leptolyngbya sp. SIO1E4]